MTQPPPTRTNARKRSGSTYWYIWKGFLKGVTANLHDAIDEQYFSQLKHLHTAYCNTTPFPLLEHLNSTWCPLNVQVNKKLKNAYFAQWDRHEHLTAFGKRLDNDQTTLVRSDITISDEDKLSSKCTTPTCSTRPR